MRLNCINVTVSGQTFNPEDEAFFELLHPSEHIPSNECVAENLYWGYGRAIGELAICRGANKYGQIGFEGLREKMGHDYLDREIHLDDDPQFGTFRPFVDLGPALQFEFEEQTMAWLLGQTIDMVQTRLNWLKAMPTARTTSEFHATTIDDDEQQLQNLLLVRDLGFSHSPVPTFRQIMESARQKQGLAPATTPSEPRNNFDRTDRRSTVNERRRRADPPTDNN